MVDRAGKIAFYMFLGASSVFISIFLNLFLAMLFLISMIALALFIGKKKTGNAMYLFTGDIETMAETDGVFRYYNCLRCNEITFQLPCTHCGSRGGKVVFDSEI